MQLDWRRSRQRGRSRRRRGRATLGAAASAEGARAADAAVAGPERRPTGALTAPRAGAAFDPAASSAPRTGTAPDPRREGRGSDRLGDEEAPRVFLLHRSRRATSVGGRAGRGRPAPAAKGGARSRSAVAGGGGGRWPTRGGAPSRPDTASCGAPPAWVRLARFDARVEEEEGEAGRSRGSAPARATVALASPVARQGRERMGKGEACRN